MKLQRILPRKYDDGAPQNEEFKHIAKRLYGDDCVGPLLSEFFAGYGKEILFTIYFSKL
jgi:hypothetical protein